MVSTFLNFAAQGDRIWLCGASDLDTIENREIYELNHHPLRKLLNFLKRER